MENETLKDGAEIWQNEVVCEIGPLFCSQEAISTYFLLYIGELWQGEGAVKIKDNHSSHLFNSAGETSLASTRKSLSAVNCTGSGHEEPSKELASALALGW